MEVKEFGLKVISKRPKDQAEKENADNENKHSFYLVKFDGKGDFKGLYFLKDKVVDFLVDWGYYRHQISRDTYIFIQVKSNLIYEVDETIITDVFEDYINNLPAFTHKCRVWQPEVKDFAIVNHDVTFEDLRRKFYSIAKDYFSKNSLLRLRSPEQIEIMQDSKTCKYFYFQNGFVEATREGATFKNYLHLDRYIWANSIIPRDYNATNETSIFEKFIKGVCTSRDRRDFNKVDFSEKRFKAFKTMLGYLLHGFFAQKLFSIVATDARPSESDEANGRTGKDIIGEGIAQMLNADENARTATFIDGREFEANNKHRWEAADLNTRFIHLSDIKKKFDFAMLFNGIVKGFTVDKKNKDPFSIQAKLYISTNQRMLIEGESARDRVRIFEFTDYYTAKFSPFDQFGTWFFTDDWNPQEWNRFYNFMINCVVDYFKFGLVEPASINLHKNTLIDNTNIDFVEFLDTFRKEGKTNYLEDFAGQPQEVEIYFKENEGMNKREIYNAFVSNYPDFKTMKQHTFTKWIKRYARATNYQPINKDLGTERRSGNIDYITFKTIENE